MATAVDEVPPGLNELYEKAANATHLRPPEIDGNACAARPELGRGPIAVLMASAWSTHSIGGAMMRLHTAWLKAKPRPITDQAVAQHAASLPLKKGKPDTKRARTELLDAYLMTVKLTADRLHGRSELVAYLTEWAQAKGIDADMAGPVLTFWLSPQCPMCHGLGERRMVDAPVLGAKCTHCHGSQKRAAPLGSAAMLDHLTYCVNSWRAHTKQRLRGR